MRTHVFDPISNKKPTNDFLPLSLSLFFSLNNNINHKEDSVTERAMFFDKNKTTRRRKKNKFSIVIVIVLILFLID
jgi:hypothetical protein